MNSVKILTVIPARSGSKRVPGKNIKLLSGKPLIAHTIIAAQRSLCLDEIIVSTDCQEIVDISLSFGATVPWLRPNNLAEDSSDVIHAVIDLLERYKAINRNFDSVLLLQPTSPFRKPATIQKAVALHKTTGHSVVSVNASSLKPSWYRTIDPDGNLVSPKIFNEEYLKRDPAEIYMLNGAIYLSSVEQIMANQSFYSEPTKALIMDNPSECIDIDTIYDWALVEKLIEIKEEVLS